MSDYESMGLRVPPHSNEAEQSLLGGLMLDNSAWNRVADLISAEDFYVHEHRGIFSTVAKLISAHKVADMITVYEAGAHEMAYLNSLCSSVISSSGARAYAEIVRERAVRRRLVKLADGLAADAFRIKDEGRDPVMAVPALIDKTVSALLATLNASTRSEPRELSELLRPYADHISAKYEGENDAIETGLIDLDRLFDGGLRRGELVVLGARPSMGKSAFVLALCRYVGAHHPVLMMTLEDSLRTLVSRMVAAAGGVNLADLRNPKRAPDSMWSGLKDGLDRLKGLKIDIDDQGGLTLMDMRRKIQQSKQRHGKLGMVVVDYLQLAQGDGDNRNQALGSVANGLKAAAKEFDVPVILLSQLNREADKRPGPPQMSDLRDSGDIEGAADIIGLLYREFMRKPTADNKHHAELHVVKNKNGATGLLNFYFDGALQRFGNWEGGRPRPSWKSPGGAHGGLD